MEHVGQSSLIIVTMSVGVSIFASFTALNLSGRLVVAEPRARRWWILAAALALGGGTWAMHFLGMLSMPMPATYEVRLTILSLFLPVAASAWGLQITTQAGLNPRSLAGGGLLVSAGIVAMHYVGMAAMHMPGVTVVYDPLFVGASIAIAVIAATAALWLAFRTHGMSQRLAASVAMGFAISGMHYTAMAGATFVVTDAPVAVDPQIQPAILALAVACATSLLLLLGLVTAYFDRALASMTAREADALTASEQRFRALIESTSDMIGLIDRDGALTYDNLSARSVLGYGSEDFIGRRPIELVAREAVAEARSFFALCLDRPGLPTTIELPLLDKSGGRRELEIVATNFLHVPAINGVVLSLRDVTERRQLMARLEMLSETDLLTGALNRRGFAKLAGREFERMRRQGDKVTIIMFDIDHFKAVNDTYGHAAGDLVLASVAACCRTELREYDLLGRHGGEEFAILLTGGDAIAVQNVIDRVRLKIGATRIASIRGRISVTASFGIATVDPRHEDLDSALARADEALYEAKNSGRNCIRISA